MAMLFAATFWLLWLRRRPRRGRLVPAGVYRDQWRRFRYVNRLSFAVFLVNPLSWFFIDHLKPAGTTVGIFLIAWLLCLTASTFAVSLFRCPRCNQRFFSTLSLSRRYCFHCGLELYEGA